MTLPIDEYSLDASLEEAAAAVTHANWGRMESTNGLYQSFELKNDTTCVPINSVDLCRH